MRIIDVLFPDDSKGNSEQSKELKERHERTRSRIRKKLEQGDFEDKIIEIEITDEPAIGMQVLGPIGMEDIGIHNWANDKVKGRVYVKRKEVAALY